jgi:NAD(P)-dependent dehydrogenase (short-subunit alcohol dehydrogenase family)
MPCLTGKIALVTGASRGIGRAVAEMLARHGAMVILTARDDALLADAAAAINQAGGHARAIAGDITDEAFVEDLFGTIRDRFDRFDILVNNAGIAPGGPVERMSPSEFRRCLELNLVAAFTCTQHAIRLMTDAGGEGKIINIGSVRSHWTETGDAGAYTTSKQGLRAMTESVARQLHGSGLNIAVGIVSPGVVDTTLTNPSCEPKPDWLQPETVARAVLHAVTVPLNVNVFETILFPMSQKPW